MKTYLIYILSIVLLAGCGGSNSDLITVSKEEKLVALRPSTQDNTDRCEVVADYRYNPSSHFQILEGGIIKEKESGEVVGSAKCRDSDCSQCGGTINVKLSSFKKDSSVIRVKPFKRKIKFKYMDKSDHQVFIESDGSTDTYATYNVKIVERLDSSGSRVLERTLLMTTPNYQHEVIEDNRVLEIANDIGVFKIFLKIPPKYEGLPTPGVIDFFGEISKNRIDFWGELDYVDGQQSKTPGFSLDLNLDALDQCQNCGSSIDFFLME